MPVRIEIGDNSNDPRVINLQEYEAGRANFKLRYFYTSAQAEFGGQVIEAPWDTLQNAVDSYVNASGVLESDVALRFVHCFDVITGDLFLRLQLCQLVESADPPPPGVVTVYDLDVTNAQWYEIKDGVFGPTADDTLFGQQYLSNFYYKADPSSGIIEPLTNGPTVFVKNLVLPWADEILKVYLNNQSPVGAFVNFAACSYVATPEHANVAWPHGMVVYLKDSAGYPMLDNNNYISLFHNKGADYATLCPPTCNQYWKPSV